ncbi:sulfotransferase [filamentous cyanobacterium CCP5]|nr:sulfotransferase [filamentous cyanobacterium CCP5]
MLDSQAQKSVVTPIKYSNLYPWIKRTIKSSRRYYTQNQREISINRIIRQIFPNLKEPIFIVGAPRSGTTFLGECLAVIPEISYHFEPVISKAAARYVYEKRWTQKKSAQFYRIVYSWLMRIHFDADLRFAEKTPRNCFLIDFLIDTFPDAKFLHIVRDGRDVALSHSKKPWFKKSEANSNKREPGGYLYGPYAQFWVEADRIREFEATSDIHRCIWSWRRFTEEAINSLSRVSQNQFIEIRYETLLTHQQDTAKKVLDFLEISSPKSQTLFLEAANTANPNLIGQWQHELTAAQLCEIEKEAGDLLQKLGYS